MTRSRLTLLVIVAMIASLGYWAADGLYLTPSRLAQLRIAQLAEQLSDLERRRLQSTRDLAQWQQPSDAPSLILTDATSDVITATTRLQESSRNAAVAADGIVTSSQTIVSELPGGLSKLSVLLRMRFAESGLLGFFRQVESASPPLIVESLDVRPLPILGDARPLDVVATISGFYGGSDAP